jgi:hypothetical protein
VFSNVLYLIAPVGVTVHKQNLSNFPAGAYAGFAIDEDHKIHSLSNQNLLRCVGRFCHKAFEADEPA